MSIQPGRLTVRLNWHGRLLDGPLSKRVKAGEACWSLDDNTQVGFLALRRVLVVVLWRVGTSVGV